MRGEGRGRGNWGEGAGTGARAREQGRGRERGVGGGAGGQGLQGRPPRPLDKSKATTQQRLATANYDVYFQNPPNTRDKKRLVT